MSSVAATEYAKLFLKAQNDVRAALIAEGLSNPPTSVVEKLATDLA